MNSTQTYDYYAAQCRKCTDRNARYDLFSALARRAIQDTNDWWLVYHRKAREAAQLIIAGTY